MSNERTSIGSPLLMSTVGGRSAVSASRHCMYSSDSNSLDVGGSGGRGSSVTAVRAECDAMNEPNS